MQLCLLSSTHDFGRDDWLAGTGLARVEIEIGPGSCGYLVAAARRDPECLHVGIEVQPGTVARVKAKRPLPENCRLLQADGGWVVQHLLAPSSVDAVHVYFPDPWWKKRHRKRRLFQTDFCEALRRALVPGGCVHVVTDVIPLFAEIRERMEESGFRTEPWDRTVNALEVSSYERKYRQQGRLLEQARFRKK